MSIAKTYNCVGIRKAEAIITRRWDRALASGKIAKPIMLHGTMGVGKSSIVHNYAKNRGYRIVDLRGSAMEAPDAQGLGFVDHSNGNLKYSTPEWWPISDEEIVILFLDEITNCSKSVQQAFYRLILDRSIQNGKTLSKNVIIIAAGNTPEDKTGAKALLPALANRFPLHLEIDKDKAAPDFLTYAIKNELHDDIVAYIGYSPESIIESPDNGPFARPRTWEDADEVLQMGLDEDDTRIELAGCIGQNQCVKFMGWRQFNHLMPNWDDLMSGVPYKLPPDNEAIHNVASHMAIQCIRNYTDTTAVENLFKVAAQLDTEHKVVFFRMLKADMEVFVELIDHEFVVDLFDTVSRYMR